MSHPKSYKYPTRYLRREGIALTGERIEGVVVRERDDIVNVQGAVIHALRADDQELFHGFGEAYVSVTNPGVIKGWHQQEGQANVLTCIAGEMPLVLFDPREGSATKGNVQRIHLSTGKRRTVLIPPGVIYGWKNAGDTPAFLLNCASRPHDPARSRKIPLDADEVPYTWD